MPEPTIICPNCRTEIKLTESLAAPLIESTRRDFEHRLTAQNAEIAKRESALKDQQAALAKARDAIDEQVAAKLKSERTAIAADEAKKARALLAADLDQKSKDLADLAEVERQRVPGIGNAPLVILIQAVSQVESANGNAPNHTPQNHTIFPEHPVPG